MSAYRKPDKLGRQFFDKRKNTGAALMMSYAKKRQKEGHRNKENVRDKRRRWEKHLERFREKRRAQEREDARKQRELEKSKNKEEKEPDKKVEKYLSRFDLECQKLDIFHDHDTAMECANEAIKQVWQ